jgi:hypothetical protein
MDPELYNIISQGISLMNVLAAKAQQENHNPESVKIYAGELQRSVRSLLKVHEEEFSPEGWRRYNATLSEINNTVAELAKCCEDSESVRQLTGGNLKTLLSQLGEVLEGERPEIRGKSFFERLKERFQ